MRVERTRRSLQEIIQALRGHQEELKETYMVRHLKIFGSYVRNEQKENSDLDLMVSFEKTPTLPEFIGLKEYLESITGVRVDLVTEEGISPYIRPYIKEVEVL